jgi:hypothetical protein
MKNCALIFHITIQRDFGLGLALPLGGILLDPIVGFGEQITPRQDISWALGFGLAGFEPRGV